MGEQSDLLRRLDEDAEWLDQHLLGLIAADVREARMRLAAMREALEGWRDHLEYLDARDAPDDPLAVARHRIHGDRIEKTRKALAGLSAAPGREGVDGA